MNDLQTPEADLEDDSLSSSGQDSDSIKDTVNISEVYSEYQEESDRHDDYDNQITVIQKGFEVDFENLTETEISDGFIPSQTHISKSVENSLTAKIFFKELKPEERFEKFKQIREELNSSLDYGCKEVGESNVNAKHVLFQVKTTENNSFDTSVKFIEGMKLKLCYFNLKYLNKDLLVKLLPILHRNAYIFFENINELNNENIGMLKDIFDDYFIDIYSLTDKMKSIAFCPKEDNTVDKFKDIKMAQRFIQKVLKSFIKEGIIVLIWNAILDEDDFHNLLESISGFIIVFFGCHI